MKKEIILFAICCLLIACDNKDPYQGQYIDLSFEEKLTFGQPDSLSESTMHYARNARLGPEGNIYAADAGVGKIKVYSPTGELVNSFGKRGRGPGEFTDIRGFTVTDSTVLIWDQDIQRITVFGLDGEFRSVHDFKGRTTSPMHIYPLKNTYLTLHGDNRYGDQLMETRLAHTYSADFSKQKANLLVLDDVNENIEDMSRIFTGWLGFVSIQNNRQFLFVPFIYGGNIYEYSKTSNGWQQTQTYQTINQQKPFSFIEEGEGKRKPDATLSSASLAEDKSYLWHNMSRGLHKYRGYIFHFTFCDIKNKRVFGVEVYDDEMNPVGYAPIKSIPITNKEDNVLVWGVEDVDEQGNFYFFQRNDKGTQIRVMQIDQQDLENL